MGRHRPFVWVILCWAAGIMLADRLPVQPALIFIGAAVCALISWRLCRRPRVSPVLLGAALVLAAAGWSLNQSRVPDSDVRHVARYYRRQPVWLEGTVVSPVRRKQTRFGKKGVFELALARIRSPWGWKEKTGRLLVNCYRPAAVRYGDVLRLQGRLYRPYDFDKEDRFSYRAYLARRGIRYLFSVKKKGPVEITGRDKGNPVIAWSLGVRRRLSGIFDSRLSANEAGIMKAILLGDRDGIPEHIRRLFIQTGTAHVLAISGLHVGMIAYMIFVVLRPLPIGRRVRYLLIIVFLILYAVMTGARPAVVRATVMACIFLISLMAEREADTVNTLCLAAFLILLARPTAIWDVGFQLSFVSVLSIVLLHPLLTALWMRWAGRPASSFGRWLLSFFAISFSAWLGVAGLIAYYFSIITPVNLLANLVVIPCISVVVALGLGLLAAHIGIPPLAYLWTVCLKFTLGVMVGLIYLMQQAPMAYIYIKNISPLFLAGYYIFLLLAVFIVMRLTKIWNCARVNDIVVKSDINRWTKRS